MINGRDALNSLARLCKTASEMVQCKQSRRENRGGQNRVWPAAPDKLLALSLVVPTPTAYAPEVLVTPSILMSDPQKPPFPGEKPANLHQRITTSPDDDEEDPLLEGLGDCKRIYAQLEARA